MPNLHHRPAFATVALAGAFATASTASTASAELMSYTFTLGGSTGSLAGAAFSDETVSWTLIADTADIRPGSPRGFNVQPLQGWATIGGLDADLADSLLENSAVWTYTAAAGPQIGFGTWEPFESFTSASYAGPLDWDMTTAFSGDVLGTESILRAISTDGMATDAGLLLITAYQSASFSATAIPSPAPLALGAIAAVSRLGGRRRRRGY